MNTVRYAASALASAILIASCSSGGDSPAVADDGDLVASVASYELEVGSPQRFLVGVTTQERELVGYGTADLRFSFTGTEEDPLEEAVPGPRATATYRLIPGQRASGDPDGTRTVSFDQGAGVYGVDDVTFDKAGFWDLSVAVELDGETRTTTTTFEVLADSTIVEVGDQAPATVNHLPGAAGVPPAAVDSRADDAEVPDPVLHQGTIADALAAKRPMLVVVSTPVYCVSRFCGPITDSVEQLAVLYGDRMAFVHLEVWRDYEEVILNKAAAEWILPKDGTEGKEPWVFLVGADGVVTHRFDNVVSDAELEAAVAEVVA